jgi:hypothetical protein
MNLFVNLFIDAKNPDKENPNILSPGFQPMKTTVNKRTIDDSSNMSSFQETDLDTIKPLQVAKPKRIEKKVQSVMPIQKIPAYATVKGK